MKNLIVLTGDSQWRGIVSGIWYEKMRSRSRLYTKIDGYLFGRYLSDVNSESNSWIVDLLSAFYELPEDIMFWDLGVEGEEDLMSWLGESPYHRRVFSRCDEHRVVWFCWGNVRMVHRIRKVYRSWLGWFNEWEFERRYGGVFSTLQRSWFTNQKGWRELVRRCPLDRRIRVAFAEKQILKSLLQTLDPGSTDNE